MYHIWYIYLLRIIIIRKYNDDKDYIYIKWWDDTKKNGKEKGLLKRGYLHTHILI